GFFHPNTHAYRLLIFKELVACIDRLFVVAISGECNYGTVFHECASLFAKKLKKMRAPLAEGFDGVSVASFSLADNGVCGG
ncbi:MAG: hypothetical protein ACOYNB_11790, partial [Aquabacterium sp.]|uniref:hypothetical protein n=1 Tax=Aquabacterium sp. TaxID=1872578 RepID=UPI003BCAA9D0